MTSRLIERILRAYTIAGATIHTPQRGYRNQSTPITLQNGDRINCIVYKSEPDIVQRIKDADSVAEVVARNGLPARTRYDPRLLQLQAQEKKTLVGLYYYLPGITIPWEAYTRRHIKLAGQAQARLHASLASFPGTQTLVIDEYGAVVQRMQRYFGQAEVREALHAKLSLKIDTGVFVRFERLLNTCRLLPDTCQLHLDFVRGNILFEGQGETLRISGIIDFEKTAYGPRLFDIARTLSFLLVDCSHIPEEKVQKYFLYSGYIKRGDSSFHPSPQNLRLLEALIDLFLCYDFYKFLRHSPYESLPENYHFMRTVALLQKRQRLFS